MSKPTATASAKMLGSVLQGLFPHLPSSAREQMLYELGAAFGSTVGNETEDTYAAVRWVESVCGRELTEKEEEIVKVGVMESDS